MREAPCGCRHTDGYIRTAAATQISALHALLHCDMMATDSDALMQLGLFARQMLEGHALADEWRAKARKKLGIRQPKGKVEEVAEETEFDVQALLDRAFKEIGR
jgi:hypothetical protein